MDEHLVEALLEAALLFEATPLQECEPQVAVGRLEALASRLQRMPFDDQQQFRAAALLIADRAGSAEEAQELRDLLDHGLLPERWMPAAVAGKAAP